MNIFYLDHDPKTCAVYHVDKHVSKMVLEYAQLLSTCHHLVDSNITTQVYKPTHVHHPSTKWVRKARANYDWLYQLFKAVNDEYAYRYGNKWHGSFIKLGSLLAYNPLLDRRPFTPPTPAMDDAFKIVDDSLASYRNYYNLGKRHLHSWTGRPVPDWISTSETLIPQQAEKTSGNI